MSKRSIGKLAARWAVAVFLVTVLVSVVAGPVIAISSGWVTSTDIKDGTILTRDIKRGAITTSRIKDHSIRKEDIRSGSINKYKLTSGAVNTYKILDGTIKDADVSPSAAISDSKIHFSTKTRHYSLSPASFRDSGAPDNPFVAADGSYILPISPAMFAPVNLPDGAIVTELSFALVDNDVKDTSATLMRTDKSENTEPLVSADSTGAAPAPREFSSSVVANPVIDNANYSYYVKIRHTFGGIRIDGAFIEYQIDGP